MKFSFGRMNPAAFWRKRGFITRQCIVVGICGTLFMAGLSALAMFYANRNMTTSLRNRVMASVRGDASLLVTRLRSASLCADDLAIALEAGEYTDAEVWELLAGQLNVRRLYGKAIYTGAIAFLPTGESPEEMRKMYSIQFPGGKSTRDFRGGGDDRYWADEWFASARDTGRGAWGEPFFNARYGNMLMVIYSVPFYRRDSHGDRRFAGVVAVGMDLEKFRQTVKADRNVASGYNVLISLKGMVITHPDPQLSGRCSIFDAAKGHPEVAKIVERIRQGEEGVMHVESTSLLNEEVLYFFTPVPETDWMLLSVFPTRLIYERLNPMRRTLAAASLGGTVLLVLLTSLVLRNSGKPLGQLEEAARRIGEGDFCAPLPDYPAEDEIGRLNRSIASMQEELRTRLDQLARNIAIREKFEGELKIARKIQQTLLPVFLPPLPECREFVLAARLTPARTVSGDLYDMFMLDEHRIALIIGDVSGKGIPAALLMSVTQTFQHCAACKCDNSGKMVACLNSLLSKNNPDMMFITYFIGIVDLCTGVMNYTNAGHNPPVLIHANGDVEELSIVHGLPIGMRPDETYDGDSIGLRPGDGIFAYTDGVTEAENPADDQFGVERMRRTLRNCAGAAPAEILAELDREVTLFADGREFADDVTMWCFKLKELKAKADAPELHV